ncbi:hypothetical protein ASPZODRAFT_58000 [Penicilliopsis zonata CBS 506.65]|uniref:Major facilitator superfamily (MFS) profile domain-containing protein n=1 Tax=Penicilliopsis zonata CBS 506.65 TaxID=1073090 RepID=A0A1L9SSK0_9EURO|nr:hypothetical protein ASPZODRAFT_58000 [Penicilliopsis zonata CBS 506.65]OJJ50182.1 hypothetical protein ASPZODRAFT_58000 [Penicilliopsis zonata CBS 506.65]
MSDIKQDPASDSETTIETSDQATPPPPPDGGMTAWLQVLGGHLLCFNSWGIINTFGAYETFYETDFMSGRTSSEISWIGTVQGFFLIVLGIIGGPIFDRGYFRHLLVTGTFLVVFGMMMTSLATTYWQVFLGQGICVGLGAGCLFLPSVAIVATYFSRRRAFATGVTVSGGSIGSVIYPIVFRRLQPSIGFPWATRVIGFIALATLTGAIAVLRTRLPPPKRARSMIDSAAFRSLPFVLFSIGSFFAFMGLYIPFFYVIFYAQSKAGMDESLAFYMLSLLNGSSVFGRIIPGLLADRFGSLQIMVLCTAVSALLSYAWIAIHDPAGLIVFCLLYGFFSGAVVSLPASVLARLPPDLGRVGTWMGMSFLVLSFGFLIGNPIAGAMIHVSEGEFSHGFVFAATMVTAAGVIFALVHFIQLRIARD